MKRTIHNILIINCMLLAGIVAKAQQKDWNKAEIAIAVQNVSLYNDSVLVDLMIHANDLNIGTRESLRLDIVLEADAHKTAFPFVLYSGKQRMSFDDRKKRMSPPQNDPVAYHIYKGIDKKQRYALHYKFKLPYEKWMEHASVYVNQIYHDCCNEWMIKKDLLCKDISPKQIMVIKEIEEVWNPDPQIYTAMVSFIVPEVEVVKNRVATVSANIDFPRNVYKVLPEFGKNPNELLKIDSLIQKITNNDLITISSLHITGCASPEGRYTSNELLAKRRSIGFKDYMIQEYKLGKTPVHNDWIAEDWNGLNELIANREMAYKQEIQDIIDKNKNPDVRERKLMQLAAGVPYRSMLEELFPRLRKIELRANYVISKITELQAKELLYTRPDLLNLDEIYRVALFYQSGTKQYREVYEIAAKQYPKDVIANNNAAAAFLKDGQTAEAKKYLSKIQNDARSYINLGVVAYIEGDLEKAESWFTKAKDLGYQQAEDNLELIKKR